MPLTATIAPARSARRRGRPRRARQRAARGVDQPQRAARTPGTRSAGRGSGGRAGPRTRPGSAAHIAKPAIVVQRPVVGHAAHDREPRPAVGAVDERVAVAAVGRVEQLAPGRPRRSPRRATERRGLAAARAGDDREAALAGRRRRSRRAPARPRPAAAPRAAAARGSLDRRRVALDLEHDAALVVAHPAGRARARRPGGRRTGRKPTPCTVAVDARATRRRGRVAVSGSTTARAGRGRRSPAPPGCAGCAPSG